MIDAEFKDALKGIGVAAAGANFVGLGLIHIGSNVAGNPAWELITAFWYIEAAIVLIAIVLAIIFIIILLAQVPQASPEQVACNRETKSLLNNSLKPILLKQKACATPLVQASAPILKPPEPVRLTTAELKKKALKQITGKEFPE